MLMFTLVKIAATPVFTKVRLAVLSTEQQDGGTLMIVAKAKFIVSPTAHFSSPPSSLLIIS